MIKRILITGGAGCLGSNLLEHLFKQGHELLVIDNFATGKKEVVPEQNRLSLVEGNIADEDLVDKSFEAFKPDFVIHSAASYKDPNNWAEDTNTNILGSIHVAKAAIKYGVRRVINFQTALCYGRPSIVPIPVNHPSNPFTSYGISKHSGEAFFAAIKLACDFISTGKHLWPTLSHWPVADILSKAKRREKMLL